MSISEQKKKLLHQGMPIVSTKTVDAVFHVYAGKKRGKHLSELRERLLQDNPQLVKFIESQVGKYPPELHNPMFEVVLSVISIIEHQIIVENKEMVS